MKYALIFLFFWGISSLCFSQNTLIKPKPEPAIFVNDYAGLLSDSEIQRLEEKLVHFDKTTTNQLAIAILPSLEGNSIEALANEWFKAQGSSYFLKTTLKLKNLCESPFGTAY